MRKSILAEAPKMPHFTLFMTLRIRLYGDSVLREKAQPITHFDAALKAFANDMIDTVHAEEGYGVAAPQVGKSLRMFVVDIRNDYGHVFTYTYDGKTPPPDILFPLVIINPVFTAKSTQTDTLSEACMSLPDVRVPVTRPEEVTISFQDTEGNFHTLETNGLFAKCIQHEYDHLDGILIIDYATAALRERLRSKLTCIRRDQKAEEKAARKG